MAGPSRSSPQDLSRPGSVAAPVSQPGSEDLLKEEMDVARQLVQDFPAEAPALALLGTAYLMHGDSVEAVKCWEACLKLNPKFAPAYDRLGTNAIKKGEYEEAVRLYRKAVEVDPAMSGVHGGLDGVKGIRPSRARPGRTTARCHIERRRTDRTRSYC